MVLLNLYNQLSYLRFYKKIIGYYILTSLVLAGPRGLGHIVAGILRVLDRPNMSSIPLTTVF